MKREQLLLYAVTDRSYLAACPLYAAVEQALLGGVTMLQLREKNMDEETLAKQVPLLLGLCRKYKVPFILDDHVELAVKLGCDGAHVGQSDMPAAEARRILGPDKILGVTAKTVEQAKAAEAAGADYLGSGAVFVSATKPNAAAMPKETLREITSAVHIPVAAIGGITKDNVQELGSLGIAGAAVSEGIFHENDICAAAAVLRNRLSAVVEPRQS